MKNQFSTNLISQLINEIELNTNDLNERVSHYSDLINELQNSIVNSKGFQLEIAYYPYSYNGRKITFGCLNGKEYERMIQDLVSENVIDEFLEYLTQTVLPQFKNGYSINDFHF